MYDSSKIKLEPYQALSVNSPEFAFQSSGELVNNYVLPNGQRYLKGFTPFPENQQKELIHGYYAAISYMDAQVGKVLEAIKANNLEKNTIIVLWGDHGWHLGDHAMWCKHSNFEQATKAPLIITSPDLKGGKTTQSLTEFVDVFPTLTDLANIKTPNSLAGKSLVPIMKKTKHIIKEYAQSQYPRNYDQTMGYTLRSKNYRIVSWYNTDFMNKNLNLKAKPVAVELFDYIKDPNEKENLAQKIGYEKFLKKHLELMNNFLSNQTLSRKN